MGLQTAGVRPSAVAALRPRLGTHLRLPQHGARCVGFPQLQQLQHHLEMG